MTYYGNCTQDEIIEDLFGDVSAFACLVEELGDNFTDRGIMCVYDPVTDIHSFYVQ